MKYLIASDLHGSKFYAEKLFERFESEKADMLILLGDLFNHGPRNPLPKDYSPMEVADLLNKNKEKLIVIKGNCDSEVDTMISDFDFVENLCLTITDKTFFLTHGHVYNKDKMPKTNFSAVIYGHFHVGFIEKQGETIIANAGSLSLPKNQSPNSYIILTEKALTLKDLSGKTIKEIQV